jgi:hypothetical protein
MSGHVRTGEKSLAVAPQIHGFVAEGRERGKCEKKPIARQPMRFTASVP